MKKIFELLFWSKLEFNLFISIALFFGVIMIIGSFPDEPKPIEPWIKTNRETSTGKVRSTNAVINRRTSYESPWESDRKQETEEWLDFLEEIENRGYDLWDPEAEDIWETYK